MLQFNFNSHTRIISDAESMTITVVQHRRVVWQVVYSGSEEDFHDFEYRLLGFAMAHKQKVEEMSTLKVIGKVCKEAHGLEEIRKYSTSWTDI